MQSDKSADRLARNYILDVNLKRVTANCWLFSRETTCSQHDLKPSPSSLHPGPYKDSADNRPQKFEKLANQMTSKRPTVPKPIAELRFHDVICHPFVTSPYVAQVTAVWRQGIRTQHLFLVTFLIIFCYSHKTGETLYIVTLYHFN